MNRTVSWTIFAVALALAAVALWGDRVRQARPYSRLALLPWHGLLFTALTAMLFIGVHLLTLTR